MSLVSGRVARDIDSLSGERAQVTALFFDIVGSTELMQRLDAEEFGNMQRLLHREAAAAVEERGGYFDRLQGDGGCAYFGLPVSTEDAAESAVAAALDMVERCIRLAEKSRPMPKLRVGLATGIVVVADTRDRSQPGDIEIIGLTSALASRVQSEAEPNSVVVTEATFRLTQRAFEFTELAPARLKGFAEPVRLWRPTGRRKHVDRFSAYRRVEAPLVGRREEVDLCRRLWRETSGGPAQLVFVQGEAGIGKSRLVAELTRELGGAVVFQCQPRGETRPLHPFLDRLLHDAQAMGDPSAKAGIGAYFRSQDIDVDEREIEILAFLCGGEDQSASMPWSAGLSVAEARERALSTILSIVGALSRRRRTLFVLEDLHWADTFTKTIVQRLSEDAGTIDGLFIVTSRENPPAELDARANLHRIVLARLTAPAIAQLAEPIWEGEVPDEMPAFVFERSEGVPLFAEELALFVKDRFGGRASTAADWQAALQGDGVLTLRDLLATRLAGLGQLRRCVQVASVIGREFDAGLLAELLRGEPDFGPLGDALERLARAGIFDQAADADRDLHRFHHVLIQETAYDGLLKADRRLLHARIVELATANPAFGLRDEALAWHSAQAGHELDAARYAIRAAEACVARSALPEADRLLVFAAGQLAQSDGSAEAEDLELGLLTVRGPVASALFGRGAEETRSIYDRGVAICAARGNEARAKWFPLYWGWWFTAPDYETQRARSDILVRDLEGADDPEVRLQSLHCAWATHNHAGRHRHCLNCVEQGLALYDETRAYYGRGRYGGHDAKVCALGERAFSLWFVGDEAGSAESMAAAMHWAERIDHLDSRLHALDYGLGLKRYQNDHAGAAAIAEEMSALAVRHALPGVLAKAKLFRGWARAMTGDPAGMAEFEDGFERQRRIGTEENRSIHGGMRAEILASRHNYGDALEVLDSTIAAATRSGQVFWLAELHRGRATLRQAVGRPADDVAADLRQALEVAARQEAAALEVRIRADIERLGLAGAISGS